MPVNHPASQKPRCHPERSERSAVVPRRCRVWHRMMNFPQITLAGDPPASSKRVAVILSAAKDPRLSLAHSTIPPRLIADTPNAELCDKGTASAGPKTLATNDSGFSPSYKFLRKSPPKVPLAGGTLSSPFVSSRSRRIRGCRSPNPLFHKRSSLIQPTRSSVTRARLQPGRKRSQQMTRASAPAICFWGNPRQRSHLPVILPGRQILVHSAFYEDGSGSS